MSSMVGSVVLCISPSQLVQLIIIQLWCSHGWDAVSRAFSQFIAFMLACVGFRGAFIEVAVVANHEDMH